MLFSVTGILSLFFRIVQETWHLTYQLDFTTPGSFPWDAMLRKQMRHIPNFRKNARGLPQRGHLL